MACLHAVSAIVAAALAAALAAAAAGPLNGHSAASSADASVCSGVELYRRVADRFNCSLYYSCEPWGPRMRSCTCGKHFSQAREECDWPERAGCDGARERLRQQQQEDDEGVTIEQRIVADACAQVTEFGPQHLPYPGNCTRFIRCSLWMYGRRPSEISQAKAQEAMKTCPPPLIFCPPVEVCSWSYMCNCVQTDNTYENTQESIENKSNANSRELIYKENRTQVDFQKGDSQNDDEARETGERKREYNHRNRDSHDKSHNENEKHFRDREEVRVLIGISPTGDVNYANYKEASSSKQENGKDDNHPQTIGSIGTYNKSSNDSNDSSALTGSQAIFGERQKPVSEDSANNEKSGNAHVNTDVSKYNDRKEDSIIKEQEPEYTDAKTHIIFREDLENKESVTDYTTNGNTSTEPNKHDANRNEENIFAQSGAEPFDGQNQRTNREDAADKRENDNVREDNVNASKYDSVSNKQTLTIEQASDSIDRDSHESLNEDTTHNKKSRTVFDQLGHLDTDINKYEAGSKEEGVSTEIEVFTTDGKRRETVGEYPSTFEDRDNIENNTDIRDERETTHDVSSNEERTTVEQGRDTTESHKIGSDSMTNNEETDENERENENTNNGDNEYNDQSNEPDVTTDKATYTINDQIHETRTEYTISKETADDKKYEEITDRDDEYNVYSHEGSVTTEQRTTAIHEYRLEKNKEKDNDQKHYEKAETTDIEYEVQSNEENITDKGADTNYDERQETVSDGTTNNEDPSYYVQNNYENDDNKYQAVDNVESATTEQIIVYIDSKTLTELSEDSGKNTESVSDEKNHETIDNDENKYNENNEENVTTEERDVSDRGEIYNTKSEAITNTEESDSDEGNHDIADDNEDTSNKEYSPDKDNNGTDDNEYKTTNIAVSTTTERSEDFTYSKESDDEEDHEMLDRDDNTSYAEINDKNVTTEEGDVSGTGEIYNTNSEYITNTEESDSDEGNDDIADDNEGTSYEDNSPDEKNNGTDDNEYKATSIVVSTTTERSEDFTNNIESDDEEDHEMLDRDDNTSNAEDNEDNVTTEQGDVFGTGDMYDTNSEEITNTEESDSDEGYDEIADDNEATSNKEYSPDEDNNGTDDNEYKATSIAVSTTTERSEDSTNSKKSDNDEEDHEKSDKDDNTSYAEINEENVTTEEGDVFGRAEIYGTNREEITNTEKSDNDEGNDGIAEYNERTTNEDNSSDEDNNRTDDNEYKAISIAISTTTERNEDSTNIKESDKDEVHHDIIDRNDNKYKADSNQYRVTTDGILSTNEERQEIISEGSGNNEGSNYDDVNGNGDNKYQTESERITTKEGEETNNGDNIETATEGMTNNEDADNFDKHQEENNHEFEVAGVGDVSTDPGAVIGGRMHDSIIIDPANNEESDYEEKPNNNEDINNNEDAVARNVEGVTVEEETVTIHGEIQVHASEPPGANNTTDDPGKDSADGSDFKAVSYDQFVESRTETIDPNSYKSGSAPTVKKERGGYAHLVKVGIVDTDTKERDSPTIDKDGIAAPGEMPFNRMGHQIVTEIAASNGKVIIVPENSASVDNVHTINKHDYNRNIEIIQPESKAVASDEGSHEAVAKAPINSKESGFVFSNPQKEGSVDTDKIFDANRNRETIATVPETIPFDDEGYMTSREASASNERPSADSDLLDIKASAGNDKPHDNLSNESVDDKQTSEGSFGVTTAWIENNDSNETRAETDSGANQNAMENLSRNNKSESDETRESGNVQRSGETEQNPQAHGNSSNTKYYTGDNYEGSGIGGGEMVPREATFYDSRNQEKGREGESCDEENSCNFQHEVDVENTNTNNHNQSDGASENTDEVSGAATIIDGRKQENETVGKSCTNNCENHEDGNNRDVNGNMRELKVGAIIDDDDNDDKQNNTNNVKACSEQNVCDSEHETVVVGADVKTQPEEDVSPDDAGGLSQEGTSDAGEAQENGEGDECKEEIRTSGLGNGEYAASGDGRPLEIHRNEKPELRDKGSGNEERRAGSPPEDMGTGSLLGDMNHMIDGIHRTIPGVTSRGWRQIF